MAQEVAAPGFSIQEFPILVLRKPEVAIDLAAAEAQIEDALPAIICRRGEQLRFKMLPVHIRSLFSFAVAGSSPGSRRVLMNALHRHVPQTRQHPRQIFANRIFSRRQVSTTESTAATFWPACSLPTLIQFFRPSTTGRIEFSAQLLLNSSSGCSRNRVSFSHSESV